jgi:hypothetical protein
MGRVTSKGVITFFNAETPGSQSNAKRMTIPVDKTYPYIVIFVLSALFAPLRLVCFGFLNEI